MKINKIELVPFDGYVYNLELNSNRSEDDLFWIEGKSNIVTHNCFPKDIQAILYVASQNNLKLPTLEGAQTTNNTVRKNKDWEKMEGRAVSKRNEPIKTQDIQEEIYK